MDELDRPTAPTQLGSDVTAALARLATLDSLDAASHVAVFELVQTELAAALADIDLPSGGGAAAPTGFDRRSVPGRPPR